jgi:hypothetical protein
MKYFLLFSSLAFALAACGGSTEAGTDSTQDTAKIPDSVPQMVRVGKEANWAYKPDTMINELLLGDAVSLLNYKHVNGNEGEDRNARLSEMVYVNTLETEQLTIFQTMEKTQTVAYGFRVKKNVRDKNSPPASNYSLARNFITSAGIYIGMSPDYVQGLYKSQPMMRWVKSDTTYLSYGPSEKDKEHYKRYHFEDYHATYKFVDERLVLMDVFIDVDAFAEQ